MASRILLHRKENLNQNSMNEQVITINEDWKTKERLQLIKNAAQGLVDVGVMSESSQITINDAVDKEMNLANLFH